MVLPIKTPTFMLIAFLFGVPEGSDEENWNDHTQKVQMFECNSPQPRSFSWNELKQNSKEYDYEVEYYDVSPESTVLHRCESAGCCPNGQTCSHKEKEIVNLTFLGINENESSAYFNITAVNHTKCSCQTEGDLPK